MNNNKVKDCNHDGAMKAWLVKKKEIWSEMHKEKKEKERREKEEKELKIRESQAAWEKWKERKETLRKQQMVGIYRYIYVLSIYIMHIWETERLPFISWYIFLIERESGEGERGPTTSNSRERREKEVNAKCSQTSENYLHLCHIYIYIYIYIHHSPSPMYHCVERKSKLLFASASLSRLSIH